MKKNLITFIFLAFGYISFAQTVNLVPLSDVTLCEKQDLTVSLAVGGVFNAGNQFSVELSDALGSFSSPVVIGSVSTVNSSNMVVNIPLGTPAGNFYRMRVTASNPVYTSPDNGVNIIINLLPSVSFTALTDICEDALPVSLNGGSGLPAGGTGIYLGNAVFSGSFYPNLSGAGNFPIQFIYTDPNGCSDTAISNQIVNPLPAVSLPPFAPLCLNDAPFTLNTGTPAGGIYKIDGIVSASLDPVAIGPGNHLIEYFYSDVAGCNNSESQYIFIQMPPTVNYSVPSSVCLNETFNLNFSPSGGTLLVNGLPSGNTVTASSLTPITIDYTFTDALTNCTSNINLVVNVNALPVISMIDDDTVCASGSVLLNYGSPSGGNYSGIGVTGGNILYPSLVGSNITDVYYTFMDANGCSNSDTISITLSPAPIVSINVPAIVCLGGTPAILSGTPAGGTFSGPGVSGNTFDPSVTGTGVFTINYSYTDVQGCTGTTAQNTTVTSGIQPAIQPIPDMCLNGSLFTLVASPVGGIFSGNGVSGNTFNPSVAGVGLHTVYYNINLPNGCSGLDSVQFTVHALPVLSLTLPGPLCSNASPVVINGGLPVGGTYSGSSVSGNLFTPSLAQTGINLVTYEFTDANSCTNTITDTILVNASTQVSTTPFSTVCYPSSSFAINNGSPVGGTWSGSGVTAGNNFDPMISGPGTFQLTYQFTDANGCTSFANENIFVQQLTVNAGPDQSVNCGSSVQLNASVTYSGTGTLSYNWTPATGLSNTNIPDPIANPTATTTYVVEVTDGICTAYDTVIVNYVSPNFGISFTASPLNFNQAPPYTVTFTNPYAGTGLYNFTWIFDDGFTQFNNLSSFNYNYFNNGQYNVILIAQDIATGCTDTIFAPFVIDIAGSNCNGMAQIQQSGMQYGCAGSTVLLNAVQVPNATYQWYFNGGPIGGANSANYNCFYSGSQVSYTGYYSVLVTDTVLNCVSMSTVLQVVFNQPPLPPVVTVTDPFVPCSGDSATLVATPGYAAYEWYRLIDSLNVLGAGNTIDITVTGVYEVIVSDANGCTNSALISIDNFGPDPSAICFVYVDSVQQRNVVIWENPATINQLQDFLLLRQSDYQFGFDTIATIPYDPNATFYKYFDNDTIGINTWGQITVPTDPQTHFYTYGLALRDVCGGTSIPSQFHTTINITASSINGGQTFDLTWNPYGGLPFAIFELHRSDSIHLDTIITFLSSNQLSFTDNNPMGAYAYWITVPLQGSCDTTRVANFRSRSNKGRNGFYTEPEAIKELNQSNLECKLIPNPSQGRFNIVIKGISTHFLHTRILTLQGEEAYLRTYNVNYNSANIQVSCPQLAPGTYLLEINDGNKRHTELIVINQ